MTAMLFGSRIDIFPLLYQRIAVLPNYYSVIFLKIYTEYIASNTSIMYNLFVFSPSLHVFSETLNLWGNGAVTLPKKWRERFPTKHFLAKELPDGSLQIRPILSVEYYEQEDGSYGVRFPMGMEAGDLADMLEAAAKDISEA